MIKAIVTAALLLTGSAAVADGRTAEGGKKKGMICRVQGETGSRLGSRKVCMTKEQWDEHKAQTRQNIERGQTQQVNKQGT